MKSPDFDNSSSKTHLLLAWGSLVLATAESVCVAAVGLSGVRVALGLSQFAGRSFSLLTYCMDRQVLHLSIMMGADTGGINV